MLKLAVISGFPLLLQRAAFESEQEQNERIVQATTEEYASMKEEYTCRIQRQNSSSGRKGSTCRYRVVSSGDWFESLHTVQKSHYPVPNHHPSHL